MRWDSPAVLVSAATLAVHLILIVVIDAIVVTHPYVPEPPAPHIETFDVDVEPPPSKAPEPTPEPEPEPEPEPAEPAKPAPTPTVRAPRASATSKAPPTETPVQPATPSTTPGGSGPVIQLGDLPTTGPGYGPGKPKVDKPGKGGRGTGTGTGTGSGAGADPPPAPPGPVSVAMLKKRALPKNDVETYTNEYPTEAKQLGIEGQILVRLTVSSEGKVKKAVLLKKLGHGLDEWALSRAKKIEFTPALDTNDQPVESTVVWTFDMTLPK